MSQVPAVWFLILLLAQGVNMAVLPSQGEGPQTYPINGPRLDEVLFVYQATPEASVAAIRKGDTDILSDIFRPTDVRDLSTDPEINITFTPQTHYCYVAFNMRKAPLNDKQLRKAVAHLVPRQEIANQLFDGVIATPMLYETSPAFGQWHNPNVDIYPYDPSKAREILSGAGYTWSNDGVLLGRDGKPLRRINFLSPTQEEAPTSYEIARLVVEEMKKLGFDAYLEGVAFDSLLTRVMTERNFDMYFLCVSNLGRFPRWLYDYYHSSQDVQDGDNTPGVRDPELDRLLYKFRFESETEDAARSAVWQAQTIIADLAARIPVYSRYEIEAYRKDWEGMIQHKGTGYFTSGAFWTYLNLHKSGVEHGGTVKVDIGGRVRTLNPLYGTGAYEQKIITLVYDSLLASDPETSEPLPYLAQNWNVTSVDSDGKRSQRIIFNLATNASWQDGEPFTSSDVKFSIEYVKKNKIPALLSTVERITEVSAPTPYTVEMTMNGTSIFNVIDAGGIIIIPEHIWKNVSDWRTFQPDREPLPSKPGLTKMIGTGPFILAEQKPEEFWTLRSNSNYFKRLALASPEAEKTGQVQPKPTPQTTSLILIGAIGAICVIGIILFRRHRMRQANGN